MIRRTTSRRKIGLTKHAPIQLLVNPRLGEVEEEGKRRMREREDGGGNGGKRRRRIGEEEGDGGDDDHDDSTIEAFADADFSLWEPLGGLLEPSAGPKRGYFESISGALRWGPLRPSWEPFGALLESS